MLQQSCSEGYIIATGETHSVKKLVDVAFAYVGLDAKDYVVVGPEVCPVDDSAILAGDATKARKKLDWRPEISFKQLVEIMVNADIKRVKQKEQSQKTVK